MYVFCVVLLVVGFVVAAGALAPVSSRPVSHNVAHPAHPAAPAGNAAAVIAAPKIELPAATAAPAAAPAALADAPPLAGRENFAFVPYWALPQSAALSLTGLSTLDYFSLDVDPNGNVDESGSGWNGYQSQALASLISLAHAAGERVVLTMSDFDQASLDALTSSPTAPSTLATQVIGLLHAKNFDGVNFDFEGAGSQDQAGLTHLMAVVSQTLRATDPHWQITMDTYASAAGDPSGFYNIAALAPSVDAFFVMAYELNLEGEPNPISPLTSSMFTDLTAIQQYEAVVPASKVILGTPFFGIDWPTANGTLQAKATGPATDVADSAVQDSTDPIYWDPATDTGWTSFLEGGQWHETFFQDPHSLYMVSELASQFHLRGVGIWALGMENDETQMVLALDGFAPAGSPGGTGPQSTAPSTSATTTPTTTTTAPATTTSAATKPKALVPTTTANSSADSVSTSSTTSTTAGPTITGMWGGSLRHLSPVGPGSVDKPLTFSTLNDFSTTDPAYSCLNGIPLTVYLYGGLTGTYVAVATTPTDCINQEFAFAG
jgi:spore germination protein YaaH